MKIVALLLTLGLASCSVVQPDCTPFDDVDLICRFTDDTPFTVTGSGAYLIANCQDRDGKEYEFIVPTQT